MLTVEEVQDLHEQEFGFRPSVRTVQNWASNGAHGTTLVGELREGIRRNSFYVFRAASVRRFFRVIGPYQKARLDRMRGAVQEPEAADV